MKTYLQLAWHFFLQENQHPSQKFMYLAQAILMVFIVTLSQTSYSIQHYLTQNLAGLLGADVVISLDGGMDQRDLAEVQQFTIDHTLVQSVATTITFGENWQRASLKGVGEGYPLQGEVTVSQALGSTEEALRHGPAMGEIWLGPRLFTSLSVSTGDTLSIGGVDFTVSGILHHEPDRLMQGHTVDMHAMIHQRNFAQLSLQMDTVKHRYLFNADASQIAPILSWQKAHLPAAQVYHRQGDHPLALFWQRTENFIGLASIILFFMAAIAIEQLTRVKVAKEQYFSAVTMSVGASRQTGLVVSIIKWMFQLAVLFPVVMMVSAATHWLIIDWLTQTFVDLKWHWPVITAVKAFFAVSALFLVFQLPIWVAIANTSVGKLIQQARTAPSVWLSSLSALLVLSGVAFIYSDNALLTLMVLTSVAVCIGLLLVVSWIGLTASEKLSRRFSGLLPFALYMMKQRLVSKTTQVLGVGLCAFLLLFTLMLMRDLGNTMNAYSRQHDGNLVVSQATQSQMADIQALAELHHFEVRQNKPYLYAKLVGVNGEDLSIYDGKPSDSLSTFQSAIRLHWTMEVPTNNRVLEGEWWSNKDTNWRQVSVEEEVMTDLGLAIGDSLTFVIGKQTESFTIVSSHGYKGGQGSITFWVQMPASAVDHFSAPQYAMASVELSDAQFDLLAPLWRKHPTLRMVSLKEMMARFDDILSMVTDIVSGFSLIISLLAALVILASVQGLEVKEKRKNSIIMSFGFDRKTCLKINVIEWVLTACIAAIGAIFGTYFAGLLIYQSQFSLSYAPDFVWLFATLAAVLVVVTAIGITASKKSLSVSIRELMTD